MGTARPMGTRGRGKLIWPVAGWCCVGAAGWLMMGPTVSADVQPVVQLGGVPAQIKPTFEETGLPPFTSPEGTSSIGPPADGTGGGSGSGGATGYTGTTTADNLMGSRSWGSAAAANAEALGVNPTALAATCMLESGCLNRAAGAGGSASGAFQFIDSTYTADMKQVVAQNPSLAGSIDTSLAGKMDPANEAYAGAQDLKNAALALQRGGVADPTILDTRGFFNFGAAAGPAIAGASPDQTMSSLLPSLSSSDLQKNGLTTSTTVGQWRQTISTKLGSAATQKVLI